ncbi:methyltransferase domain-containing protein [Candidatus Woesearchaeota archaeon]|nr:methyltransferase domain-containing protein [Candidatus Woesearchaeota archaeon]
MSSVHEVLITSGGIISKIDDVRSLGNMSKGTTGALIAEGFLTRGIIVHYVCGKNTEMPFRKALALDPTQPIDDLIKKVRDAHAQYNQLSHLLHVHITETFNEYLSTVQRILLTRPIDAAIMAAAVPDYSVPASPGKISSDCETLTIHCTRNPKVISLIKQWCPGVFLVGFKLLADAEPQTLIETAYQQGIKNNANLTVANTIYRGDFGQRTTYIITPEKGITPVSTGDIATKLTEMICQRVSQRHYATELTIDKKYQSTYSEDITSFRQIVQKFWRLNLFEPYAEADDMHFGFVAMRLKEGFLITARGSSKKDLPPEDIVRVRGVDFDRRVVHVISEGKKASLNANVAAIIFAQRPEVSIILHAHIFPGTDNKTTVDYAPGTEEDMSEVMSHLRDKNIVEVVNHGMIALGKTSEDIIQLLGEEHVYKQCPLWYDAVYNRFHQSSDFLGLVMQTVRKEEAILDVAAGTGEVTAHLVNNGYTTIAMADKRSSMLAIAQQKAPGSQVYEADMTTMRLGRRFNTIAIRQAINYAMDYAGLVQTFRTMHTHLRQNGRLIFNAPNAVAAEFSEKMFTYEINDYVLHVREMNTVENGVVTHTQLCRAIKKDGTAIEKIYDLNRFGLFSKADFEKALHEAGFRTVSFFGKGLNTYTPESKSLYCVARK